MMNLRISLIALAGLALASCDNAGSALKTSAGDFAKEATRTASGMVSLKTACTVAGQSEAFCGCVEERLGARLDPAQLKGVTDVIIEAVKTGSLEGAAQNATALPPETRTALVQCAARATVAGVVGEASGQ
jgi:hypothetical protein